MNIAIVIVNWNGRKYLKNCFDSIKSQTVKDFKVIFVDNGSEDDSVDFVKKNYHDTEIIKLKNNTGFCFGYNTGIKKALEDEKIKYMVVLNNDTKLDEKFLEKIVDCAKRHPDAGSIQPKVVNFFEKGKIDCAGIYISRDGTAHNRGYGQDEKKYNEEKEIFGANGTASLFTREALEKTMLPGHNYFDNSYFAFYEDVDLAWRIRNSGFKSYYCPKAHVWHIHGGTAGKASLLKAYYLHRNYFFTIFKNYSCGKMAKTLCWRFLSYLQLVVNVFKKKKREMDFLQGHSKVKAWIMIVKAWGSVILNFPELLKKRRFMAKNKMKKALLSISIAAAVFSLGFSYARAESLKIGFVTDWEYGNQKKVTHKFPRKAKTYLRAAVNYYNLNYHPDIVVGGGDYVLGNGKKKSVKKQMRTINNIFKSIDTQRLYCIGNHDLRKMSKNEVQKALGIDYNHSVTDKGGIRLITLDTNSFAPGTRKYQTLGQVSAEELTWLESQLETDLPVLVFSHHAPIETPEGTSNRMNMVESDELRTVLEKNGNVVAVFSGHHAINHQEEINGINYVIINNLNDKNTRGSFAAIDVEKVEDGDVNIQIEQFGRAPASYNFSKIFSAN